MYWYGEEEGGTLYTFEAGEWHSGPLMTAFFLRQIDLVVDVGQQPAAARDGLLKAACRRGRMAYRHQVMNAAVLLKRQLGPYSTWPLGVDAVLAQLRRGRNVAIVSGVREAASRAGLLRAAEVSGYAAVDVRCF